MAESRHEHYSTSIIGTTMSTRIHTRQVRVSGIENLCICWLVESHKHESENHAETISYLQQIVNLVRTFRTPDELADFASEMKHQKLFVIISIGFAEYIFPVLHDLPQINSIYVLCHESIEQDKWMLQYRKFKGVYTNIEDICKHLKTHANQTEHSLASITIFNSDILQAKDKVDLNTIDSSFIYSQLIKDMILEVPYEQAEMILIDEFVGFCRNKYADNSTTLQVINEFYREYHLRTPAWWYTRDTFVYRMLNHALRTSEAEVLIRMAFFIKDLHRQIEQLHSTLSNVPTVVYRGQNMTKEEFEKLKQGGGGLLSFNNFLSTTKDRSLAYGYAFTAVGNPEVIGVLFQMTIDPKIRSSPFASLDTISYFQGNQSEQEVLFSMCTIFRISQIKQLVTGIWQVDLQLTNEDDDPQLYELIQFIRKQVGQLPGLLRLGHLMYYMGEWDQSEAFFATVAKVHSHQKSLVATMHSNVAQILALKGDFNGALLHNQCALRIVKTLSISEQQKVHKIFNNIGDICMRQAEIQAFKINTKPEDLLYVLKQSLQYFQTALHLALKYSETDLQSIAVYHNNIGGALKLLQCYDEALESFNQCLQIELKLLPSTHFSLATTYNNIASVSYYLKDYDNALSNYHQCLTIQRRSLPSKHPLISDTCCNIAMTYDAKSGYKEAVKYIKEAVEIGSHCFSSNDTKLQLYQMTFLQISKKL